MREQRYREAEQAYFDSLGLAVEERTVRLPSTGTKLRVLEAGDGPPLLFVHGGASSGAGYAPLVAAMRSRRCIVIDRPGNGLSEPLPEPLDLAGFERFADGFVADVLDAVELDWADLVTTSLGNWIGLRSVAAHPERVRRYAAIAYVFGAPGPKWPMMMRITAMRRLAALMTKLPAPRPVVKSMLGQLGLVDALEDGRVTDEGIAWFGSVINDTDTMKNEIRTLPPIVDFKHGLAPEALLGNAVLGAIDRPGLFLWGTGDPFGGADIAEAFVERVNGARLELLDGLGHAPWLEEPERMARSIESFLAAPD